jgi:hypothetical protein
MYPSALILLRKSAAGGTKKMPYSISTCRFYLAMGVVGIGLLAACATQQSTTEHTEQMLAAAGFVEKPADTPKRQARLASLAPYHLMAQVIHAGGQDTVGYVYADPNFCHCVYVGHPEAYARYQQLAFQEHLAQEQIAAEEMEDNDVFGWDDWGPYPYWGGGGVVVVRGGFHHGFAGGPHR